jgi:hypothetical protein
MEQHQSNPYKPKDAIGQMGEYALTAGALGLFASAVQNAMQKKNVGAMGVFTHSGGTILTSGMRLILFYASLFCWL